MWLNLAKNKENMVVIVFVVVDIGAAFYLVFNSTVRL